VFNQKFFEQFLPYFLFEKLASAGRQDFVDTLRKAVAFQMESNDFSFFTPHIGGPFEEWYYCLFEFSANNLLGLLIITPGSCII